MSDVEEGRTARNSKEKVACVLLCIVVYVSCRELGEREGSVKGPSLCEDGIEGQVFTLGIVNIRKPWLSPQTSSPDQPVEVTL